MNGNRTRNLVSFPVARLNVEIDGEADRPPYPPFGSPMAIREVLVTAFPSPDDQWAILYFGRFQATRSRSGENLVAEIEVRIATINTGEGGVGDGQFPLSSVELRTAQTIWVPVGLLAVADFELGAVWQGHRPIGRLSMHSASGAEMNFPSTEAGLIRADTRIPVGNFQNQYLIPPDVYPLGRVGLSSPLVSVPARSGDLTYLVPGMTLLQDFFAGGSVALWEMLFSLSPANTSDRGFFASERVELTNNMIEVDLSPRLAHYDVIALWPFAHPKSKAYALERLSVFVSKLARTSPDNGRFPLIGPIFEGLLHAEVEGYEFTRGTNRYFLVLRMRHQLPDWAPASGASTNAAHLTETDPDTARKRADSSAGDGSFRKGEVGEDSTILDPAALSLPDRSQPIRLSHSDPSVKQRFRVTRKRSEAVGGLPTNSAKGGKKKAKRLPKTSRTAALKKERGADAPHASFSRDSGTDRKEADNPAGIARLRLVLDAATHIADSYAGEIVHLDIGAKRVEKDGVMLSHVPLDRSIRKAPLHYWLRKRKGQPRLLLVFQLRLRGRSWVFIDPETTETQRKRLRILPVDSPSRPDAIAPTIREHVIKASNESFVWANMECSGAFDWKHSWTKETGLVARLKSEVFGSLLSQD